MPKTWTMRQLRQELRGFEDALHRAGHRDNTVQTYVGRSDTFLRWIDGKYVPRGPIGGKTAGGRARRAKSPAGPSHHSHGTPGRLEVQSQARTEPFDFRWPSQAIEHFDPAWELSVKADNATYRIRHGITRREAFGRQRVRSVTWVNAQPAVEGTETEGYGEDHMLASVLKINGRVHVKRPTDVPPGYEQLDVVRFSDVVDGPGAFSSYAVQLRDDDLAGWARHAILRHRAKER